MPRAIAQQGDTLDAICWRVFGQTRGYVERVLEMNPGIAEHGPVLPIGLTVELPEATTDQPTTQTINLWD